MTSAAAISEPDALHEAIGGTPEWAMAKVISAAEGHAERWMNASRLIAIGVRSGRASGASIHLVSPIPGSSVRLSREGTVIEFGLGDDALAELESMRAGRCGFGSLWLIPGLEETLRINGVATLVANTLRISVREVFMHCAKAFKRSAFWGVPADSMGSGKSPGADAVSFVEQSPFLLLATTDESGHVDVSPRGDPVGQFCRFAEGGQTLLVPDRPGNKMAASMHNILTCRQASAVLLRPGTAEVVEVTGNWSITQQPDVLAAMAVGGKVPRLALRVSQMTMRSREHPSLVRASLWDADSYASRGSWPSFARMLIDQMAQGAAAMRR